MKTSLNGEGNSHPSSRNPESSKQDKPKTKHPKIYITQINKDQAQTTNIKSSKGKITHKGIPIRITADLTIETLQARREWQDILKVMKQKNLQPRLLYPTRISFKYEEEIKSFTDKQKENSAPPNQLVKNAKGSSLDRNHRKGV